MTDHQRYINALRKCAKEHENDRTFTGHIIVSDLCRDTANLLESLQSNSDGDCISRKDAEMCLTANITNMTIEEYISMVGDRLKGLPSIQPKPIEGDATSRAEMLEVIHECEKHLEPTWKWKEMLSKLPSIQPKTMQVELEGDGYADGQLVYDYGKCPKCGWDFEYGDKDWEEPYCCHCGQKLHWFESEEQE